MLETFLSIFSKRRLPQTEVRYYDALIKGDRIQSFQTDIICTLTHGSGGHYRKDFSLLYRGDRVLGIEDAYFLRQSLKVEVASYPAILIQDQRIISFLMFVESYAMKLDGITFTATLHPSPVPVELPCDRCGYSTSSKYLPCAVNPLQFGKGCEHWEEI